MSKINTKDIEKYIQLLENRIFPEYASALGKEQAELIKFLNDQKLSQDQIIAGLIQGMSNASFQLAVKLSFLLTTLLNDPDFDFDNPEDINEITNIFFSERDPKKHALDFLN